MIKPTDWDIVQAATGEGYPQLPKGGYVLTIKAARVANVNGYEQLVLLIDIEEGEYSGYFQKRYNHDKKNGTDAKWRGVYKQFVTKKDGTTNPFFKGLINCIEKSNGFVWDFNENNLINKKMGGLFGLEEFRGSDGKAVSIVKMLQPRSVDVIRNGDFKIPADKLLTNAQDARQEKQANAFYGEMAENDDDLPF